MKTTASGAILLAVSLAGPPTWAQVGGAGGSAAASERAAVAVIDHRPKMPILQLLADYVTTWLRRAQRHEHPSR
jgi:hypothetical protein